MEVTIQHLPLLSHSLLVVANVHWRRALCRHQIEGTLLSLGILLLMEGVWKLRHLGWVCCTLGVVRDT
jgi:hypothetical protein